MGPARTADADEVLLAIPLASIPAGYMMAPESDSMSREGVPTRLAPIVIQVFPLYDEELLSCLGRKELSRACCSLFCGPFQSAVAMRHAGRGKPTAVGVCCLDSCARCSQACFVASSARLSGVAAAKGAAGTATVAAPSAVPCLLWGAAACVTTSALAYVFNGINKERGSKSMCGALMISWVYCPFCTTFQISRAVDPDNEGWI